MSFVLDRLDLSLVSRLREPLFRECERVGVQVEESDELCLGEGADGRGGVEACADADLEVGGLA